MTLIRQGSQDAPPLRVGLVGCGGRGTGAARDCLMAAPNVEIVAMGDMFPDRIKKCREVLGELNHPGFKVKDEMCFSGWDNYKRVIDSGIDYVLLATPPAFRPMHFEEAVAAGKHTFVEKPVAVDPVGVRKVIEIGKKAKEKNLGVLAGTMFRYQPVVAEGVKRIRDGQIGKVLAARSYRLSGTLWVKPREAGQSDMEYQMRNWYYFDWLSGDHIVEQHVHTLDMIDFALGARPVRALGMGGRQVRTAEEYGNIYDHFGIDYEYPDGVHVFHLGRQMENCHGYITCHIVGSEGTLDLRYGVITGKNPWKCDEKLLKVNPYVEEQKALIASLRAGKPINEAEQVALSTLTSILGREVAYTGKSITWDEMLNSNMDLSPPKYEFGPHPARPVAMPGKQS